MLISKFLWSVSPVGYEWIEAESVYTDPSDAVPPSQRVFLIDRECLGQMSEARRYAPIEQETGLYRIFADVDPSPEHILQFANTYGSLGGFCSTPISVSGVEVRGESLQGWKNEISAMRGLVAIWDRISQKDLTGLAETVKWITPRRVVLKGTDLAFNFIAAKLMDSIARGRDSLMPPYDFELVDIASENFNLAALGNFRVGDLIEPATYCVTFILEMYLRLLGFSLVYPPGIPELRISPQSLIGALWLQFAIAVDGKKVYRQCRDCRKWYEFSGHAARADKIFCSPSCKASAHRKKQEEARRLKREGIALKEIAKQLGTKVTNVKGWIAK